MTTEDLGPVIDTSTAPEGARVVEPLLPDLLLTQQHQMCPGCGQPYTVRRLPRGARGAGRGAAVDRCRRYRLLHEFQQLDGRRPRAGAPRAHAVVATGVKRMLPDSVVFTLQGDGDMVNEGLQEVLHAGHTARASRASS